MVDLMPGAVIKAKNLWIMQVIGPRGESGTIILLLGCSFKPIPNSLLLYPYISTSLIAYQGSFFLQQMTRQKSTAFQYMSRRDSRVLSPKFDVCLTHTPSKAWGPSQKRGKRQRQWTNIEKQCFRYTAEQLYTGTHYACDSMSKTCPGSSKTMWPQRNSVVIF